MKFFSLILAEKPLFFPDFPDWKVFKIFPEFPDFPDWWEPCDCHPATTILKKNVFSLVGGGPCTKQVPGASCMNILKIVGNCISVSIYPRQPKPSPPHFPSNSDLPLSITGSVTQIQNSQKKLISSFSGLGVGVSNVQF